MRVVEVVERRVPLRSVGSNAVVSFADHDVSLVVVVTDIVRNGKRLVGCAFNSIGRFAQSGILRSRVLPRLSAATPDDLLNEDGTLFDPGKVRDIALMNEKPGGHGDRAAAVAAVELAFWDINAKLHDEPACTTIARAAGRTVADPSVSVYAAGGYYQPGNTNQHLADELRRYQALGYTEYKIKIGGAPVSIDVSRIEEALAVAGSGAGLSVDANCRFDRSSALAYGRLLEPYDLRWFEEPGDPLDFELNSGLADHYSGALATGENLFSVQDVRNLALHGGMRAGHDIFQMDAGLSYGLGEYMDMLAVLDEHGFDRRQAFPHGGHLINLHIVAGLGLGGCESYPGHFQPFGGFGPAVTVDDGRVSIGDDAGFGLEQMPELGSLIREMTT